MNFTNLSRYSGLSERTYRRQYSDPFGFISVNACLIIQAIASARFQVGAIDCSFIPKSGGATYGIERFYNGKASRSEWGLEISTIAVVDVAASISYALSAQQTPAALSLDDSADDEVAVMTRTDHYLKHVRDSRTYLPASVRHLVADAAYSTLKWVKAITQLELEVIGKLRRDANLRYVYEGPQKPRGAPRKYDGKVSFDNLSRWQALGEVKPNVSLYTAIVWSVNLKRKIRVVYLLNQPFPERSYTALLFSTDLELDPIALYQAYRSRFQIEFIFRDAKQFTGLTDCQARDVQKLDFHFNASLTALNLAKWDAYQQRDTTQPFIFSMASYKRRKLNLHLLERFIRNFDLDETLIKSHPNYQNLCDYGIMVS
ncbi:MAG: transposase [Cyanobacteria bacterium P01_D01_bin.36]